MLAGWTWRAEIGSIDWKCPLLVSEDLTRMSEVLREEPLMPV